MAVEGQGELDIPVSLGMALRAERESQGMSEREAADRLNWMPGYVAVIESESYEKLRSPAFARGYVKAYARLLGLNQDELLDQFDHSRAESEQESRSIGREARPLRLQNTGMGVAVGLISLVLVGVFMWWRSS